MDNTFKQLVIMFILGALFIFSFLSFSTIFSIDNNTNVSFIKDTGMNKTFYEINRTLHESREISDSQFNATSQDEITTNADSLTIKSIWGSITKFFTIVKEVTNVITGLLSKLGLGYVFIGGLLTIVVIVIIFLAWKTIRIGE